MKTHDTDNLVNDDFGTVMSAEYQLEIAIDGVKMLEKLAGLTSKVV